jgi:hypothetical protein
MKNIELYKLIDNDEEKHSVDILFLKRTVYTRI